nr:hypothetical protein CFP56_63089 [Quercus suber]
MDSQRSGLNSSPLIDCETAVPLIKNILAKLDLHYAMYPDSRPQHSAFGQPPSLLQQAASTLKELETPFELPGPALPPPQSPCQKSDQKAGLKRKYCETADAQIDQSIKSQKLDNAVLPNSTIIKNNGSPTGAAKEHPFQPTGEMTEHDVAATPIQESRTCTSSTHDSTGDGNMQIMDVLDADIIDPNPTHARVDSRARQIVYGTKDHQQVGWLRSVLTVSRDAHCSSLMCYNTSFFLRSSSHSNSQYIPIGEISAYRIIKNASTLSIPLKDWRFDLLQRPVPIQENIALEETILCMRALYWAKSGLPRKNLGPHVDTLKNNDVMFISGVLVYPSHQQLGLLSQAMEDFEALLTQLPATCAFTGPLVLVPAPLLDYDLYWGSDFRDERGQLDDGKVIQCLTRSYEKCGFAMWVKDQKVGQGLYDVMGKMVPGSHVEGERDLELVSKTAKKSSLPPSPPEKKKEQQEQKRRRSLKSLKEINLQRAAAAATVAAAAAAAAKKKKTETPLPLSSASPPEPTKKKRRSLRSLKEINERKAAAAQAVVRRRTPSPLPPFPPHMQLSTAEYRMVSAIVKEEFGLRPRRR